MSPQTSYRTYQIWGVKIHTCPVDLPDSDRLIRFTFNKLLDNQIESESGILNLYCRFNTQKNIEGYQKPQAPYPTVYNHPPVCVRACLYTWIFDTPEKQLRETAETTCPPFQTILSPKLFDDVSESHPQYYRSTPNLPRSIIYKTVSSLLFCAE